MQDFLVLGNIPGTNIQITFTMWLCGMAVFTISAIVLMGAPKLRSRIYHYIASLRARKIAQYLTQHHLQ